MIPTYSEYYIVFKSGEHWLSRFMKQDCSHITIWVRDRFQWLKLDPQVSKLTWEITAIRAEEQKPWLHDRATGHERVIYIRTGTLSNFFGIFNLGTCVSVAKYIIGVKVMAWTPWQLYKKLAKLSELEKSYFNVFELRTIK